MWEENPFSLALHSFRNQCPSLETGYLNHTHVHTIGNILVIILIVTDLDIFRHQEVA